MYAPTVYVGEKYQKLARVYDAMSQIGLDPSWKKDVQPIDLTLEGFIDPSKNVLSFQTRKGTSNTDQPDEIRVDTNDLILITHLALGIRKVDKAVTPYNYSNVPTYFYPETNAFAGTKSGSANEAAALETVYGGKLALKTGNFTIFDEVKTINFRKVPQRQYTGTNTLSTFPSTFDHAQFDMATCYEDLVQIFALFGSQNYTFELTYGTGDRTIADGSYNAAGSAIAAAGTRNEVVIFAKGYKVVGGCTAAFKQEVIRF